MIFELLSGCLLSRRSHLLAIYVMPHSFDNTSRVKIVSCFYIAYSWHGLHQDVDT